MHFYVPAELENTVLIFLVCVYLLLMIILRCLTCQQQINLAAVRPETARIPETAIGKADIEQVFPDIFVQDSPTCIICLMSIEFDEPGRKLQCSHCFHAECILQWWTYTERAALECPLCKQQQDMSRSVVRECWGA